MFNALFDFFINLLSDDMGNGGYIMLNAYTDSILVDGNPLSYAEYFSLIFSLISFTFILVLCCLFIYKIIKLVGGLIR